jgi:hypothetical protein
MGRNKKTKENKLNKISISICDKNDNLLKTKKINKSKLIRTLLTEFFNIKQDDNL